jgi:hypothetical protein
MGLAAFERMRREAAAKAAEAQQPATVLTSAGPVAMPVLTEYKAVHRGRGSWSVMVNGVETIERLTKADAAMFNAASPAEQAAFVASRAKG